MWLIVFFDVPTQSPEQKAAYRHFRDFLLNDGYIHLQHSVYVRRCHNLNNAHTPQAPIDRRAPPPKKTGQLRSFTLTNRQFDRMQVFNGRMSEAAGPPTTQLMLL